MPRDPVGMTDIFVFSLSMTDIFVEIDQNPRQTSVDPAEPSTVRLATPRPP